MRMSVEIFYTSLLQAAEAVKLMDSLWAAGVQT